MTVTNVWSGGVTQDSANVVTKVSSSSTVRVEVSTSPSFTSPIFFGPVTPSAENIARVTLTSLAPNTRYFYRVEHGGVPDASFPGQFKTFPITGQPASFVVGAASCAGAGADVPGVGAVLAASRLSNHYVFDTMRLQAITDNWLTFFHMGDIHYYDLGSGSFGIVGGGSLTNYRRAIDDVLLQTRQHEFYRNVPIEHMHDDHDWGPNDADGDIPERLNALQVWRERFPYGDLPLAGTDEPSYRAKQIGRVLFIIWDTRSESSPGAAADGPSKVMLSASQKAWMANLLATTTAEALVVVNTRQWDHPSGNDTWAAYTFDRELILDILEEPGIDGKAWLDRMCIIQGDAHSVGIQSGPANAFGGFPVFQFAAMDATVGGAQPWKDLGSFNQHGQYGTIAVDDDGDTITITGTGWHFVTDGAPPVPILSHSFQIDTGEPAPPIDPPVIPAPVPVARAQIRRRVTWFGCDLVSGRVIAELPDTMGSVSRVVGAYTNTQLTVPIPGGGHGAINTELIRQATRPRRTMMVNVINDIPAWGGIVLTRKGGTAGVIELGLASLENYLDHRYVGNHAWTSQDVSSVIAAGLLDDAADEGIGFTVDAPASGILRDREYFEYDDATIYSRLQELSRAVGIEWTVDLDWVDDGHQVITKIIRVYPRIGVAYGGTPPAVFQALGGSVFSSEGVSDTVYTLTEEHTRGRSANHVIASSSGQGEDIPRSTPARDEAALAAGAPRFELRFSPSTSIINLDVLNEHAESELARRKGGALLWSIESRWDAYPRYGVDWQLGDDVAWQVKGHWHPDGIIGLGRALGWELNVQAGTLGLILAEDAEGA